MLAIHTLVERLVQFIILKYDTVVMDRASQTELNWLNWNQISNIGNK